MLKRLTGVACAIALVILASVYAAFVIHSSYQPSLRRGELIQPNRADASPHGNDAAGGPTASDEWALPVKILSARKSAAEVAQSLQEKNLHAANESRLTAANELLAVFTLLLALVALFQVGLFWRQLGIMKDGLIDAKTAADASAHAAIAATRQAQVAEETLLKKERPYLFAFGPRFIIEGEQSLSHYIKVSIANFGALPAVIDEVFFDVMAGERKPPTPGVIGAWHSLVRDNVISAAERRNNIVIEVNRAIEIKDTGSVIVDVTGGNSRPIWFIAIQGNEYIFFRMIIKYHGPFSRNHVTERTCVYDTDASEFIEWGGEEYNYTK